jgi:hypothetical protein
MKMATIPAKLKVSKVDQYCPKLQFFYEIGQSHFSLFPHFTLYDNCMTFELCSGLQHHVVIVGI